MNLKISAIILSTRQPLLPSEILVYSNKNFYWSYSFKKNFFEVSTALTFPLTCYYLEDWLLINLLLTNFKILLRYLARRFI